MVVRENLEQRFQITGSVRMDERQLNQTNLNPLGELKTIYRGRQLGRRGRVLLWIGTMLALGFFLAVNAWRLFRSYPSDLALIQGEADFWLLVAYLALLILGTAFSLKYFESKRFIAIHENGIRWRMSGLRRHQLFWDQIAGIATAVIQEQFINIPLRCHHLGILYPIGRDPIIFQETVPDAPEMIAKIKEKFYPHLKSRLEAQSLTDQPLWFGPVVVLSDGLHVPRRISNHDFYLHLPRRINSRAIPWQDIRYLAVQCGMLVVKSGNYGTKHIPVSQIPNLELLLELIEQKVNQ
jgi:hypothetical protein